MRNIELKARRADIENTEEIARELAVSELHAELRQVDTYFNTNKGRMKLREEAGNNAANHLVYYEREDTPGPKKSNYELVPAPDPKSLKQAMTFALGILVVVKKKRTVYMWKNVRIHIDRVVGLGDFIEFEAVMPDGAPDEEGEELVKFLMAEFDIKEEDLVECSYSDLLLGKTEEQSE